MTFADAITDAYLMATGKTSGLVVGSSDYNALKALGIRFYREWQVEPNAGEWDSLYSLIGAGTVTTTDTFELDTDINFISRLPGNFVRVLLSSGQFIQYETLNPQQLYQWRYRNGVAKVADNQIKFSKKFVTGEQAIGGTIQVPAIIKLDDLANPTDEVLIDNPAWLPARMASQFVLTNRQRNYLYSDLLAQANNLMQGMIDNNGSGNETTSTGIDYFASLGNVGNDWNSW